jgi:hypothetical protein
MVDREPPGIDWAHICVEAVNLAADATKRDAQDVVTLSWRSQWSDR